MAFMLRIYAQVLVLLLCPIGLQGQNAIRVVPNNNHTPEGFKTSAIVIDFDGQYTESQLLLNLNTGVVFRALYALPNGAPISAGLEGAFPDLYYDTVMSEGGYGISGYPTGRGAIDLGGEAEASWPAVTTEAPFTIDSTWDRSHRVSPAIDLTDVLAAKLTLSDGSTGDFAYLMVVDGEQYRVEGEIVGGRLMIVPEPSVALVVFFGASFSVLKGRKD